MKRKVGGTEIKRNFSFPSLNFSFHCLKNSDETMMKE
mgnify:CR=1 FL=1